MKKNWEIRSLVALFCILLLPHAPIYAQSDKPEHPNLITTVKGIKLIKENIGKYPLIDKSIREMKILVDPELNREKDFPIPRDPAGGYTHEKHKSNYLMMYRAAMLYQVLDEKQYADYVKQMLMGYVELYPDLELHPNGKSYSPGKIFWQGLNDAAFLVHVIQAYDCVYYALTAEERKRIETDLLKPLADFLSVGSPKMFNRIHNHGIWLNAAVGLTGYALKDSELIERALYGAEIDTTLAIYSHVDYNDPALKGFDPKRPAGYYKQLDNLFSPQGYFTEGPYYQRFALWPFVLLAQAIENNDKSIGIFDYRDAILKKALYTALQLSNTNGDFFPFNDALKGMAFTSPELILALNVIYQNYDEDPELIYVAEIQDRVTFNEGGFKVAKNVAEGKAKPFIWKPVNLGDGADGKQGGVGILRHGPSSDQLCQIMRYTSHGLAHGHYDKLTQLLYDQGNEILQDYGAARWVAVIQKRGGRYLPENTTWAKQTISHNTLVVDERSHFDGDIDVSSKYHSDLFYYDVSQPTYQIMSAVEKNAYPGIKMHRTFVMVTDPKLKQPLVLDIFDVKSETRHQLDLPFHYLGEIMDLPFEHEVNTTLLEPLGSANGYQHLWLMAKGISKEPQAKFTWLNDGRFYTLTTVTDENTELLLCRLGANDPEFNLRPDPAFILRQKNAGDHTFVSVLEPHGSKSLTREIVTDPYGNVRQLKIIYQDEDYIVVEVSLEEGTLQAALSLTSNDVGEAHSLMIDGRQMNWEGPYGQWLTER